MLKKTERTTTVYDYTPCCDVCGEVTGEGGYLKIPIPEYVASETDVKIGSFIRVHTPECYMELKANARGCLWLRSLEEE